MAERKTVTLEPGDIFLNTVKRKGNETGTSRLYQVQDVNKGSEGDYVWSFSALGELNVPSSYTIILRPEERDGKKATIPAEYTTDGGLLTHTIEKTTAPEGTRWSYKD